MRPFSRCLSSSQFALAAVLTFAWFVAGAAAQIAPAPLIYWSADEEQPVRPPIGLIHPNQVVPVAATAPVAAAKSDPRRLAPPSHALPISLGKAPPSLGKTRADHEALPFNLPRIESLTTAAAGLAIVVGLFLVCAWLMRRSGPKPSSPLPREAVSVLGRVPLVANHFAHLLQLGNKLVLVSVSPESVTTLAEVTDPNEVQRLLGLCLRNHKHSTTAEFHQVLEELANEPARGFLGDQASRGYARAGRA